MLNQTSKRLFLENLRERLGFQTRVDQTRFEHTSWGPVDGPSWPRGIFQKGLHEIVAANGSHHPAALAFGLLAAHATADHRPLLVVSLDHNDQDNGRLYGAGLAALGIDPMLVFEAKTRTEKDLLWTVEEGVSCAGLAAVIAVLDRKERLYGFTASRRIKLRQEKTGIPVFLARHAHGDATAASTRSLIMARPSEGILVPSNHLPLLSAPRAALQLVRHLGSPPQTWEIAFDASNGLRMVAEVQNGPFAASAGAIENAA